jgi:hypothetical protein
VHADFEQDIRLAQARSFRVAEWRESELTRFA